MKKNLFISFALLATFLVTAQQKNILLEQPFWKKSPDVSSVKAEILKGNDPSESNDRAFDAVVMAINNDAPNETIKFLLEQKGNDVNKSTHDNRIYLHWAAYKGNAEIVQYLIDNGSNVNLEDSHGATPASFAASVGQSNTAVYDALFQAGINPKSKYKDGANLLLLAISSDKKLELSNYFISKGMSLKDVDNDGNTAFDYAARTGDLTLLKILVGKGIKYTNNALLFAAEGSRRETNTLETFKYLVDDLKLKSTVLSKEGQTVLHYIVKKTKQTEIINYFIAKNVNVNKADDDGNTALMNAALSRDEENLSILLPIVKNKNAQNTKGESALTIAVKSGSPEAVSLLLNNGADVNVLDKDGNNLGFYLIQSYRPQISRGPEGANALKQDPFTEKAKLLQNKGLNLVEPQKDGNTLYHLAVIKNDLSLLNKISDLNIDVNVKNRDGLTALHKAAMVSNDDSLLKYLISKGARKDIITDFDETAYALAKENETLTSKHVSVEFLK